MLCLMPPRTQLALLTVRALLALKPLIPRSVVLHGLAVIQMQDSALCLIEPHAVVLSPLIKAVQVSLQSLPTLEQINIPIQFTVICKYIEGTLNPHVQIINKDLKQDRLQNSALRNMARHWLPNGFSSIHLNSLGLAI
ncbi:integral membrane protein dgcr2 idd [Willisornis vidua]|uniref:Integral membrane protein dgcr2 idd n=1 Tax=Willisornis vidua TaxID=1566151 RepID=A0ABQ9DAP6_9PASS|nr:integral membrane protein dgcr2 idd [Willisornis vidua]